MAFYSMSQHFPNIFLQDEVAGYVKNKLEKSATLEGVDLSHYAIKGTEEEWDSAISGGKTSVSIKRFVSFLAMAS